MTKFVYMESSPALQGKASKFGASYRRMAVVEVENDCDRPARIDIRAKGVVRIVEEVTASVGRTDRSHGKCERDRLRALADRLNAGAT